MDHSWIIFMDCEWNIYENLMGIWIIHGVFMGSWIIQMTYHNDVYIYITIWGYHGESSLENSPKTEL